MGLESRYRETFSKADREKGDALRGFVTVFEGGPARLVCEVADAQELFEVKLTCSDKRVSVLCDCSSIKNKTCSHIWASMLNADKFQLFKEGYKRGVRLEGTAAAMPENKKKIPVQKQRKYTVSTNHNLLELREVIFVLNGIESIHCECLRIDLFWRPVGKQGPIKPLDPFSSLDGIVNNDVRSIQKLSVFNIAWSRGLRLTDDAGIIPIFQDLISSGKLFTRKSVNQKQFKKVKHFSEGKIDFKTELTAESKYNLFLNFAGIPLSEIVYSGRKFFITARELFTASKDISAVTKHIMEKGCEVNSWDVEDFVEKVLMKSNIDLSFLPGRMNCTKGTGEVQGHLFIRTALYKFRDKEQLHADLSFQYGAKRIPENETAPEVLDFYNSRILQRDNEAEEEMREFLRSLGFRYNENSHKEEYGWKLSPSKLPEIVEALLRKEWIVIAEGKTYTAPKSFQLTLTSGTDWFDIKGEAEYENEVVPVAGLVKASKDGSRFVQLGDGTYGILPEDWLKHYTVLTQLGEVVGDDLRFRKSQALIIEKLLADKLETDAGFKALSRSLKKTQKILPVLCHSKFNGVLRPYQQEGLSWLHFLEKTGFGGILADDMGLGKTVQILALLQLSQKLSQKPALLIVPRSLIFNWQSEIIKFTPDLSFLIYSGTSRRSMIASFDTADIIITTYGTVRQDIEYLINYTFNYCILDESQAIKNRDSSTAKAIRLLNASHRLSMSGTPVENSLSDLVNQFEFLNPGMTAQGRLATLIQGDEKLNKKTLKTLKEAFLPFILRRTKKEVAKELPEKVEQVIYCDMEPEQKEIYDQTLAWYRQELSKDKSPEAGKKKGVEFLGALTRLRQLACHPRLVNDETDCRSSVKISILTERLQELICENHRVLIFSQFTSFLALIRDELILRGWKHCYLDGSTSDRQRQVETFQSDESIPVFLISLKAGGVGLNLTGADYVFLMDPWWNPAIESQAVDRAYRIGQKKQVIASRLVCRGTVEEKVLQMQNKKRELAESLIGDDELIIGKMSLDEMKDLLN